MADNTSVQKDLGKVTAYAYAKAAGYTGTEEQFQQIFNEFTEEAPGLLDRLDEAVDAAEAAQEAAEAAEAAVDSTIDTAVEEAVAATTAIVDAAVEAAEAAQDAAEDAQAAAETAAATFETDTTLLVSGKAADAKVTGDNFTQLSTAANYNRDSLLYDFIPYATNGSFSATSSGNTVTMTQAENLLTLDGTSYATSTQATTKVQISGVARWWNAIDTPDDAKVYPLKLKQGHIYKLTANVKSGTRTVNSGNGNLIFRLIDAQENRLASATMASTDNSVELEYTANDENATVRVYWSRQMTCTNLVIEIVLIDITNEKNIADNTENIETITETLFLKKASIISKYTSGEYWNAESTTAVSGEGSAYYRFDPIEVSAGEKIYIHIYGGSSSKQYPVLAVKSNYEIIEHYGSRSIGNDLEITVPANTAYLLLTSQGSTTVVNVTCEKVIDTNPKLTSFYGCKMSLLGDSFSAIKGHSTNGHNYYPNVGSDVQLTSQIWWKIVADELEMTPLVTDAWSGSCVTSGVRSDTDYKPASDPTRCEALDDGTSNPDVIFVAMGTNDYSYMDSDSEFGTWDGSTALGSETDLSDYINTDFRSAYATMLARIQYKYPNAYIICLTPWYTHRYDTDTGVTFLNEIGKSVADYAAAIEEIAGIMHCPVINVTDIGFNRYNYYPTYSKDSETKPTHVTIAGQKQIAKSILAQISNLNRLGG